jgi:hypothetical protein
MADTGCYIKVAAKEIGCDYPSLVTLLGTDQFSARASIAKRAGAEAQEALALAALEAIPDEGHAATVARQRELASHYRWAAKVRDPQRYSEKLAVGGDPDAPAIKHDVSHDLTSDALELLSKIRG